MNTNTLMVNPLAEYRLVKADSRVVGIEFFSPVRGRSLNRLTADRRRTPKLFESLVAVARALRAQERTVALTPGEQRWLAKHGVLVSESQVARRVSHEQRLTDLELLARTPLAEATTMAARADLTISDRSSLLLDGHAVTVTDPVWRIATRYALSQEERLALAALLRGECDARALAPSFVRALCAAGILTSPRAIAQRLERPGEARAAAHSSFASRRFAVARGLVVGPEIAALRRYHRALVAEGLMTLGDPQSKRYWAYNDAHARELQGRLTKVISEIVGRDVKPTYTYTGVYQPGASLERHTDREQCEYTLSLQVDYAPEPESETSWALGIETGCGDELIHLSLGDGAIFAGRELPHWRDALELGEFSTSLFLHYVDADFTGPME